MRPVALSQIAAWVEGRHLGADVSVEAVGTDTRTLPPGALFVALRGEHFDAHTLVPQAEAAGASALLLHRDVESALPRILCADTEEALGEFAAGMQKDRPAVVVALTGSNGKTSVKMLTHGILARTGRTYINPGNRNNEIGLPLAVIDAPEDAQFAIYEMGAGKPGDIAYLASIAPPQVALVNNIAPAHIAGTRRIFRFGVENGGDLHASRIRHEVDGSRFMLNTPAGRADIRLPLPGAHNVLNALAAGALALAAGADLDAIVQGLENAVPVKGRQIAHALANGVVLVDDSYNANPGSVLAAIATLAQSGCEAWLVLGDMAELGGGASALHSEIGAEARAAGLAGLWTVGKLSRSASAAFGHGARHFDSQQALVDSLRETLAVRGATPLRILVKGSRSSAMDKVVGALLADATPKPGEGGHAA